jgi:Ca2+-binding EF-hand superfamily protein
MSRRISDDELEEIKEMFEHYDRDGNGSIDREEFASLCRALGGGFDPDEMTLGFDAIDTNHNGVIEFSEFLEWWSSQS